MPFRSIGLDSRILQAMEQVGYAEPTPVQSVAIPKILRGEDVIAIAQTGTGKTAAFLLPILDRLSKPNSEQSETGRKKSVPERDQREDPEGKPKKGKGKKRAIRTLILVPTRELAEQIKENVRSYGRHVPVRAVAIYGGVDESDQIKALQRGVDIVVATPGRLLDLMKKRRTNLSRLETLVLDEADRMLHMGFLPDIGTIVESLPKRRQTLMFSATLSREIESLARRFQYRPKMVQIGERSNPPDTVNQSIYEVPSHRKSALLLRLLRDPKFTMVLVFVRMKDGADRLEKLLRESGVKVAKLHSSRTQEQRGKALQAFKDGKVQVLVATDIAGRGIDIEGVSHVVNFDFPVNPEDYVHRIGRTGRAETQGVAISFVPKEDLNLLEHLERFIRRDLDRRRLKDFDYTAPAPKSKDGEAPVRRDWRKRTREREAKKHQRSKGRSSTSAKREKRNPKRKRKP